MVLRVAVYKSLKTVEFS